MLQDWTEESIRYLRCAAEHSGYYQRLAEKIVPRLPRESHVCDAGCGMGQLSTALLPHCRWVTAVDRSSAALKDIKEKQYPNLTVLCGDIEELAPAQPYDAMVFCMFGRIKDTLRIAAEQCSGPVFLIKRDETAHCFSAGQESLGEFTAQHTLRSLEEWGITCRMETFSLEFGQPLRSIEDAERFLALYNRSPGKDLSREEVLQRLRQGETEDFPYYLPRRKKLCLFEFQAEDIPKENI